MKPDHFHSLQDVVKKIKVGFRELDSLRKEHLDEEVEDKWQLQQIV